MSTGLTTLEKQIFEQQQINMQKLEKQILEKEFIIKDLLPAHITIDKFIRVIKTAIVKNMELLQAERSSLFQACFDCAKDGLLPDGREAAFVIYNTKLKINGKDVKVDGKDKWVKNAAYIPMLSGVLKLIRNSGELASISTHVVYKNDFFDYELGDNEYIKHKPVLTDRGNAICAYAIAKMKDGAIYRAIMSHADIEAIRATIKNSYNEYAIWTKHWGEMAKKTVIHRLAKIIPKSTDLIDNVLARDNVLYDNIDNNNILVNPVDTLQIQQQPPSKFKPAKPGEQIATSKESSQVQDQLQSIPDITNISTEVEEDAPISDSVLAQDNEFFIERAK